MKNWFRKLLRMEAPIEDYRDNLKRQQIEDVELPVGDWRWRGTYKLIQYKYWCGCGTELTDGPRGGAAVCAVCEKCKINYGADLPGYWGH